MFRQADQHKRCNAYIGQWCRVFLFDFIITSAQGRVWVLKKAKEEFEFVLFFDDFIYFISFREQDKGDFNPLRWSAPVGLEPAYTRM